MSEKFTEIHLQLQAAPESRTLLFRYVVEIVRAASRVPEAGRLPTLRAAAAVGPWDENKCPGESGALLPICGVVEAKSTGMVAPSSDCKSSTT